MMLCSATLSHSYSLSIYKQPNGRVCFETSSSPVATQRLIKDQWWHYLYSERWLQHLRVELVMDEYQLIARLNRLNRERLIALYHQGFPIRCGDFYTNYSRCSVSEFLALIDSLDRLQKDPNFEFCWLSYEQMKALVKFVTPAHDHFRIGSKIH